MTIIEELAAFSVGLNARDLPQNVVEECKRLLLDSMGCALGGHETPKGRAGVEVGLAIGGGSRESTIVGSVRRSSVFGAAFAMGELINAQDFDPILPPGHVTPYVLPGILCEGERQDVSGEQLICAIAVSHEISYRFGKAMDNLRDVKDGVPTMPHVFGYSSTVFGAAAGVGIVRSFEIDEMTNALGLAGLIAPANSFGSWAMHMPPTTLKYLSGGVLAQSALTAAHLALQGDRGDIELLDDSDYGFARYMGTTKWEPHYLVEGLGTEWTFPDNVSYKPWPHARGSHGALTALAAVITEHGLEPSEIRAVRAWSEAFASSYPAWQNRNIIDVQDAQFSMIHALSLCAHSVPPGRAWQDPDVVFDRSVLDLMNRTTYEAHPNYADAVTTHANRRPTRVEVDARGATFSAECLFPKGTPSSDPTSTMSNDELASKFHSNASVLLDDGAIEIATDALLGMETESSTRRILRLLVPRFRG